MALTVALRMGWAFASASAVLLAHLEGWSEPP